MRYRLLLLLTFFLTTPSAAQQWHTVHYPTPGPMEIHGSYANGCFSGGMTIPIKGAGYEQVRASRNRNHGSPNIQQFVDSLDQFGHQQQRIIILGDISQPRGGPANFGHSSHQTGLDIDIWLEDRNTHLTKHDQENLYTSSVVNPEAGLINQHWTPFYRDLLYHAATYPDTERIFVNPVIKAQLCAMETDKAWLEKSALGMAMTPISMSDSNAPQEAADASLKHRFQRVLGATINSKTGSMIRLNGPAHPHRKTQNLRQNPLKKYYL